MYRLARTLLSGVGKRALWTGLVALPMSACLLPQNDHFLPEVPPQKNRPPRILESTVMPTSRAPQIGNGPHCQLTFSFNIEDPDINDNLTVFWFVDYNANSLTSSPVWFNLIDNPSGRIQRSDSAEYVVQVANPATPLHEHGTHRVEAVVADGPLVSHDQVLDHESAADAGPNLSYLVTYGWVVDVTPEDCAAQ